MDWDEVEREHIGAISCGVHPQGMTRTEFMIARKIYLLQEIHEDTESVQWWLYVLDREVGYEHLQGFGKTEKAKIKRAITRRINALKLNLIKAYGIGEPATETILQPDVEEWMK